MIVAGTQLGRYEIRSKIGAGGMGEVYLADDTRLRRNVALKILPANVPADRVRMERFVQELSPSIKLRLPLGRATPAQSPLLLWLMPKPDSRKQPGKF